MASYDSQYRKYLDSVPQDNTQGNPLLNKALGVAATGGAIYAAYKTGVLSAGLESAIGLGAKTRLNALKTEAFEESLRENLSRHHALDMFNPRFYREIQAGYNLRVNRIEQAGVFGQNTASIGRRIEVNAAQENLTSYITNALRFKNVTNSIDEARFGADAEAIQDAVQKYNSWKLFRADSAGTASKVLGDLKLNGDRGVIVDQLSNRIKEASELYHGDTIHQNQEFNTIYNNIVGQLQEQYNLSLRGKSSNQSWFEKVLDGTKYKRATIKDMTDANAFAPTAKPSMQIDPVTKQTSFTEQTMDWNQHFKDLIKENPAIGDLYADGGVFVDQTSGKLVDLRHIGSGFRKRLEYLSTDFEVPFIGLNPLRLLHISSLNSTRNAPFTKFYKRGEFDVVLAGGNDPLQSHVLVAGRKAFDLSTGGTIKDNIYLASAIYGVIPKAMYGMAGYERAEVVRAKEHAGWLRKAFDFNFQEYESAPGKMWGAVTKWSNPEWARNKYKYFEGVVGDSTIIRQTNLFQKIDADIDVLGEAYHDIYNILNSRTGTLSIEQTVRLANTTVNNGGNVQTVASLYGMSPDEFATAINDDVYTIGKRMVEQITGGDAALDTAPTRDKLLQHIEKYTSNPMYYGNKFRLASGEKAPLMDDVFSMREDYGTKRIGFTEDTLRYLQMDMLWQVQRFNRTSEDVVSQLTKGAMRNDATNLENMLVLNNIMGKNSKLFNQIIVDGAKDSTVKSEGINELVSNLGSKDDPWTLNTLSERIMRYTPAWGSGPGLPPPDYLSKEYMVVNRAVNPLRVVNDLIKSGASLNEIVQGAAKSTIGQLGLGPSGFRAGRGNMDDVTTATIASYFGVQRLEQALGSMHVGLSNASMGSTQDLYLNLIGRRMIMPALLIGYAGYGNYLVDKITGINPKETAADAYVNARVRMAGFKDVTGVNALFKRLSNIFPGADQMTDWMGVKALNTLTFGALSSQTAQEAYDYYYGEGVDPIRKGRYWPAGSNTPWSGGRISYFEPNWYRRLKTDYLMSDSMYGSRSEYYANQWYPTLSNPLGPIKSILIDPNHWYNKHYADRPYPSSGGAPFISEIPIIGPAAAGILDKLGIVPDTKRGGLEKAHMDYLRAINDYIKTGAQGYGYTTPSGKTAPVTLYPGAQDQVGSGGGTYGVAVNGAGGIPVYGHLGYGAAQARGNLAAINNGIVMRGAIANMRFSTPDMYRDLVDVVDLDTVESPTGASYRAGETYYSLTEMAGIYGFALSSFVTGDNKPQPGLATATYMASGRHRFWEQNLGGLGGNLSEIFRRFLPNDKYRRNAYNPYRNTMPEWLPLELRYGDPYTMPRGEARMPGDAYERLHQLHPDEFGEYGAIDRVKILADVAPYSEEYRLWLNIARAMPLTAAGRKEVTAADDRVSAIKRKYRFYPYRFSGLGDITEQTLHVTKEIDQNTWLTAEYPNNPIRLAAIHVPQSDPKAEEARARVGEYLYSGATVKVGMNADLSQRFKNDTMNTIPVVVYTREGKSLQRELLAEYGDVIKEKKIDNNPVTIHAMFNKEERIVGRLWEHFAHLDTPWHTKFMHVRSPLEEYRRSIVYGKEWQPWTEPIQSILIPTLQAIAAKPPITAIAFTGGLGFLMGSTFGPARKMLTIGGMTVGGMLSTARVLGESISGHTYIPGRVQKQREIDEYFDKLKYLKYKGLYERARKVALNLEGIDIGTVLDNKQGKGKTNKEANKYLTEIKHLAKLYPESERMVAMNKTINKIKAAQAQQRSLAPLGPYALQAMYYRAQYEGTMYGADPHGDFTQVYRAMPKREREFFNEFIKAKPSERAQILNVVPNEEKRFLQAKWGMEVDEPETIQAYFGKHHLPDANWSGWRPDVSLDDVKLKVVRNEAMDISDFGFWDEDIPYSQSAPGISMNNSNISLFGIQNRILRIMRGAGLRDVDIRINHGPVTEAMTYNVNVSVENDSSKQFVNNINQNMYRLGDVINT